MVICVLSSMQRDHSIPSNSEVLHSLLLGVVYAHEK